MDDTVLICKRGDLNKIKKIINNENIYTIFYYVCKFGHLNIVKYLHGLNIDVRTCDTTKYILSYRHNQLNVIKWLYRLNIDTYNKDDLMVKVSCSYGHLEVVKYLIGLNKDINIYTYCTISFRKSCENGHLNIVKYLMTLYPGYNYKIDKDKNIIPIIKTDKEMEIERISKFGVEMLNCKCDLIINV